MGLKIGIVGLPNVGKSTVFNALSGAQNAEVANYPFCTIQPNRAIVPLYDLRLEKLQSLVGVPNIIFATIEFVDIAGLVKGASQGEGLGNQFLGNIRDVDAIVHVVRCFEDPNVSHISGDINPSEDIDTINLELVIADLEQLERKIERLTSEVKGDKKLLPVMEMAQSLKAHLEAGNPASNFKDRASEPFKSLAQELRFLTSKPVIYTANLDEDGLAEDGELTKQVREIAGEHNADFLTVCAKLESEMVDMSEGERAEFLALAGIEESGLNQVVSKGFAILDLISFFTKNENEVRAWNIPQGTTAPKAAGEIHTDFERGFIRAEVVSIDSFEEYGSDSALKTAGQMRSEGKEYIVQDGDVILFRFNI